MNASQKLFVNTFFTYGRSVITLGLTLFSSRWLLNALGHTDFGLFSLVGAIITFIQFINSIMLASVTRFLSFHIGREDSREVTRWFNTALGFHLVIVLILLPLGWVLGNYLFLHVLQIPPSRFDASVWIFRISLISVLVFILSAPFISLFMAHQNIVEFSAWGTLQAVLIFILAYSLFSVTCDRLKFYAAVMVGIFAFIQAILVIRAVIRFRECRIVPQQMFNRERLKKIISFGLWNLIGDGSTMARDQGAAILLNICCGVKLNAAFGIARQVSIKANELSMAMYGAFSPEITVCEGRGDRTRALALSHRACKFGTVLVALFAVPLILEMDYILKIWLIDPPEYTAIFCRLILSAFVLDRFTSGYTLAVNAYGKNAGYQTTVGLILLMSLPIAWLFLHIGWPPPSVGVAILIAYTLCTIGRLYWLRHLFREPILKWVSNVLVPCAFIILCAFPLPCILQHTMEASFLRLVCIGAISVLTIVACTWGFAMKQDEKEFVIKNFLKLMNKFGKLDKLIHYIRK